MPRGSKPPAGPLARNAAALLRAALKNAGITQAQAGEALGESQTQVGKYLRGEQALNVDQIQALCDMVGLDFHELMREAGRRADA